MAEEFNKYSTNVWPNLASKVQNTSKTFEDFLFPVEKNIEYRDLNFEEFEKAFKSVKCKKAVHSSFSENIFPEQLKVANVSRIFNVGNIEEVGNYRPISFFPYAPKY